jgi:dsRNA-specific ribonuclease
MASYTKEKFREFIQSVLSRANLGPKYTEAFTDEASMIEFAKAFTHKSIDPVDNYEFYEILGDSTTNKVVVWYFIRRFPEVFNEAKGKGGNMGPVAIMARLKQNGVSKTTYALFAETLGFWPYIVRADEEIKNRKKITEDVFEAFCGCLELLVDTKVTDHSGYGIVYKIMKTLMDPMTVSLEREELYDAKSLLNEVILGFKKRLQIKYISQDEISAVKASNDPGAFQRRYVVRVEIFDTNTGITHTSPYAYGPSVKEGEKRAAQSVLKSDMIKKINL